MSGLVGNSRRHVLSCRGSIPFDEMTDNASSARHARDTGYK